MCAEGVEMANINGAAGWGLDKRVEISILKVFFFLLLTFSLPVFTDLWIGSCKINAHLIQFTNTITIKTGVYFLLT